MNDERLRALYAELMQARAGAERAVCVTPEAIAALVERSGNETDRLATLDHVMSCPDCSRDFELLRSVDRAGPALVHRPAFRRRAVGIAATIVLLVTATLFWRTTGNPGPSFRGSEDAVTLVGPSGDVPADDPLRLVWNRVPDAVRYDVEILDVAGEPVWSVTTMDTLVTVSTGAGLAADQPLRWWVQVTLPDSRTLRSPVSEFVRR
jgi:hypothetical protein